MRKAFIKTLFHIAYISLILLIVSANSARADGSSQDVRVLEKEKPVERELNSGERHSYRIDLASGQYLHIVAEQRGIDIGLAFSGPDGKQIVYIDYLGSTRGNEEIFLTAENAGAYILEVRSAHEKRPRGRYEAKITELRQAVSQDAVRADAEKLLAEACRAVRGKTADEQRPGLDKCAEALKLWRSVGDKYWEAKTVLIVCNLHLALGEARKALDYLDEPLKFFQSSGDRYYEAAARSFFGYGYYQIGEYRKAKEYFDQALSVYRDFGDRALEAIMLNNLATILSSFSEQRKAIELYEQALQIYRSDGLAREEANALTNLGWLYDQLDEKQKALDLYDQALPLWKAEGDPNGEARILNGKALVYDNLGDKQKALDLYDQALTIFRVAGNRGSEATVLSNLGVVYNALGDYRKALELYDKALPISRELEDRPQEAFLHNNIGSAYNELGENGKAIDHHKQALSIWRAIDYKRQEALTLSNIGKLYFDLKDYAKALDYHMQSLALRKKANDRGGQAVSLYNIGAAEAESGRNEQGLETFAQALSIAREVKNPRTEAAALRGMAFTERKIGKIDEARAHIEAAIKIVESLRENVKGNQLRISYFATVRDYYEIYIDLLMNLNQKRPSEGFDFAALQASERARARCLLETMIKAGADIGQNIDPQRYSSLVQFVPLDLKEIQQQFLDKDSLLLEYVLCDERSYLWAVTTDSITVHTLPGRAEVEKSARRVYDLITERNRRIAGETIEERGRRLAKAESEYPAAAAELSRMLLGPAARKLDGKRLLIAADGILNYIPFAALPLPEEDSTAAKENRPLVISNEAINLPSVSALAALRRELSGRKPAELNIAALADPVFDLEDPRISRADRGKTSTEQASRSGDRILERAVEETAIDGGVHLPRLPSTRDEANAIAKLVSESDRKLALGFDANRSLVLSAELGKYRIVHFATHGLLNSAHPELSGIVLSLIDEHGRPQNGFLRLREIYELRLPVDLVTLSACQTALGKDVVGEGIVGVARGFMQAGAARVMASLWKVDDEATSELMALFYIGVLKEGRRPGAALRAAQMAMLKRKGRQSPFYWAGFVLQGEWRP